MVSVLPLRSYRVSARRVAPTILFATMCNITDSALPSTLKGPPVSALVPPGKCQFKSERKSVTLMERVAVSPTSSVLRFALPDSKSPLNLSTCACILAHATVNGEDVTRPYTPISTNQQVGSFDLLVKNYGETAKMSRHMHEIQPGDSIEVSHIDFNVKIQAPFDCDFIGMLVGGTGITPMIQALHAILGDKNCKTKVCMLYGSKSSDDILGSDLLNKWAKDHSDRFSCLDVLSHEPSDSNWKGLRGYIDRSLIEKYFPAPTESSLKLFVCGPPPMYDALCGPRGEADKVTGLLGEMGYTPDQVYKF